MEKHGGSGSAAGANFYLSTFCHFFLFLHDFQRF